MTNLPPKSQAEDRDAAPSRIRHRVPPGRAKRAAPRPPRLLPRRRARHYHSPPGTPAAPVPMQNSKPPVATPTIKRRLICLVYEVFLLTAVVMLGLFVFLFPPRKCEGRVVGVRPPGGPVPGRRAPISSTVDRQRPHAGDEDLAHQAGQGGPRAGAVSRRRAALCAGLGLGIAGARRLFAPRLTCKAEVAPRSAIRGAWGTTAFLDKDRQFLHDRLAGTRLILLPKAARVVKPKAAAKAG